MLTTGLLAAILWSGLQAAETEQGQAGRWAKSVVTLEVSRKSYDFIQPWNTRTRSALKTGVVLGKRQILTTADDLFDRTLVRLQKDGTGEWWTGQVEWIDYYVNLALITCKTDDFWEGLTPAKLGRVPVDAPLLIARWREANLELRRAEFTRYSVAAAALSGFNHVLLFCDSDITGVGNGEPLLCNGDLAGIVADQDGRGCSVIPASLVHSVLSARDSNDYHGVGYFHWYWQPTVNTDLLSRLRLPGRPRGVLVIDVPDRLDALEETVRVNDIVLQIDEFAIDTSGNYQDPEFGRVLLENLASKNRWAGDVLMLKVWRDGKEQIVPYKLPRYEYSNYLVPAARFDHAPEYLIIGGLVFQPLTDEFLQSWGADWKRKAPFRLLYYRNQPKTKERPSLVVLSQVLPDPYNIGYQDQRLLVVDKVNGRFVTRLSDLREALSKPLHDFQIVEFMPGETLKRIVLDSGEAQAEATARVLERYGIREAQRLSD